MTSVVERVKKAFLGIMVGTIDSWEQRAAAMPGMHVGESGKLVRFEILRGKLRAENSGLDPAVAPIMPATMLGVMQSLRSLNKNPVEVRDDVDPGFWEKLQTYAFGLGVSSVGYIQVPEQWIFADKGILHRNAIVMTMEMDKVRMDTAPSSASAQAVFEIYRDLGVIANKLATWLRKQGYSAHAGHPLGGLALYPPLAQAAGLGWLGENGLIITPEHGPRVRLAAVYTNIEDMPFNTANLHGWIADFCAQCGLCKHKCPSQAIYDAPIEYANGRVTCVDNDRCFPYFNEHRGCSVCIKECPFNNVPYDKLKAGYERMATKG